MAEPIMRRVYLKYSGDANYLRLFIEELTKQYAESLEFDKRMGYTTANAKVELNMPGLDIEWGQIPVRHWKHEEEINDTKCNRKKV